MFGKSFLVPINIAEDKFADLISTLGCQLGLGSMPFTYLGLPLGTIRPAAHEVIPILTRMEKHLRLRLARRVLAWIGAQTPSPVEQRPHRIQLPLLG